MAKKRYNKKRRLTAFEIERKERKKAEELKAKNRKERKVCIIVFSILMAIVVGMFVYYVGDIVKRDQYYLESNFWTTSNTEVRILIDSDMAECSIEKAESSSENEIIMHLATKELQERFKFLKEGTVQFFADVYKIDVSKKMEKLKDIVIYKTDNLEAESEAGYCKYLNGDIKFCADGTAMLFINSIIIFEDYFTDSVIVHQIMHYLGFIEKDGNCFIMEGIADSLAYKCMNYLKIESVFYVTEPILCAANQIILCDKDIVVDSIKNGYCNINEKINTRLEGINQPYLKVNDIANLLEWSLSYWWWNEEISDYEAGVIMFQIQDIITNYCKTFFPNEYQIEKIRKNYLVLSYEACNVSKYEEGEKIEFEFFK